MKLSKKFLKENGFEKDEDFKTWMLPLPGSLAIDYCKGGLPSLSGGQHADHLIDIPTEELVLETIDLFTRIEAEQ